MGLRGSGFRVFWGVGVQGLGFDGDVVRIGGSYTLWGLKTRGISLGLASEGFCYWAIRGYRNNGKKMETPF